MLNRTASLAMSTSVLKALPGKLDINYTHLVFSIYYVTATSSSNDASQRIQELMGDAPLIIKTPYIIMVSKKKIHYLCEDSQLLVLMSVRVKKIVR